jgi:hypothetical protein
MRVGALAAPVPEAQIKRSFLRRFFSKKRLLRLPLP